MRMLLTLSLLAILSFCANAQTGPALTSFVLETSFGTSTPVNDSTFQVPTTHPGSQLGQGYNAQNIEVGHLAVDGFGRRYRVSAIIGTPTFNSGVFQFVELQDFNQPPTGVNVIYAPIPDTDLIPLGYSDGGSLGLTFAASQRVLLHNFLSITNGTSTIDSSRMDGGVFVAWIDGIEVFRDTTYAEDIRYKNTGGALVAATNLEEGVTENGVNIGVQALVINAIRAALGIGLLDEDMGSYTGGIITPNSTQSAINQELSDAINSAGDDLGNHTAEQDLDMDGFIISGLDDGTGVTDAVNYGQLQQLETNLQSSKPDSVVGRESAGLYYLDHYIDGALVFSTALPDQVSSDFGRVWYVSKSSGDNATGAVGDQFKPFLDPFYLIDSVQAGDIVAVLDGVYTVNLTSNSALYDNSVSGQYPVQGANGVTYYWAENTGMQSVGCPSNTGFYRCGVRAGEGFIAYEFPENLPDYKLSVVGKGSFKGATLYHYAMAGDGLVPGTSRRYPPRGVYLEADTVQVDGAAVELYGGDLDMTCNFRYMDVSDQCVGGGRAAIHFGSFGSQTAYRVDSINGVFNVGYLFMEPSAGGNNEYPFFGNSGAGSDDFADLNLTLNVEFAQIDSVPYRGAFVAWAPETTAERINIAVNGKNVKQEASNLSALVQVRGVVSGNISVNIENADLKTPLFRDEGGSTSSETLNLIFTGAYRLAREGVLLEGSGRTTGRRIVLDGLFNCEKQLLLSTATEADMPSQIIFTGTAFGADSVLFQTEKDLYYRGASFSDQPLFRSTSSAEIFTTTAPDYLDFDGAQRSEQGQRWRSETFTATAAQATYTTTTSNLPSDGASVMVFYDGVLKEETTDYTYVASTGVLTFSPTLSAGIVVRVQFFD